MIAYKRPKQPAGFDKRVAQARSDVAALRGQFPDHWRRYKREFETAQGQGKCAYCEGRSTAQDFGAVEHFRPKDHVQALSPAPKHDDVQGVKLARKHVGARATGYAFLAYEWSNYLFACTRCNSIWKKNQFPLAGGRRARSLDAVDKERALLVDPLASREVEEHFAFDGDGLVWGLTAEGRASVQVLGLDRATLCRERRLKAARIEKLLDDLALAVHERSAKLTQSLLQSLLAECRAHDAYAGFARYLVAKALGYTRADLARLL